ncbi:MAG: hypothetical protein NVS2B12_05640 [Ktedonobacteraceae bacterium]
MILTPVLSVPPDTAPGMLTLVLSALPDVVPTMLALALSVLPDIAAMMLVLVLSVEPKRQCPVVNFLSHKSTAYILLPVQNLHVTPYKLSYACFGENNKIASILRSLIFDQIIHANILKVNA